MPKKLNLSTIKVQSFVTSLGNDEKQKVKGGTDPQETNDPRQRLCVSEELSCAGTFCTCGDTCACETWNYTCDTCMMHCTNATCDC